jgi:serine/threonine-protein kinase
MVHRDVKPASIYLLDPTGERLKLLGLGVAKLQEALLGDRFRTSPEAVIGTFEYLSPEQALGKFGSEIDGRSDLYSLGVVMYEMLTAHLPFHATTPADWMTSHIQSTPVSMRATYPHLMIPDVLTELVMLCLKKSREHRPASAGDFIRRLEAAEQEIVRPKEDKRAEPRARRRTKSSGWAFWKK